MSLETVLALIVAVTTCTGLVLVATAEPRPPVDTSQDSPGADDEWVRILREMNAELEPEPQPTYMGLPVYVSDAIEPGQVLFFTDLPGSPGGVFVHPSTRHQLLMRAGR